MKALKLRIKDEHSKHLQQLAREVNLVWNYVNELGFKYWQRHKKFLSAYDIRAYNAGASMDKCATASSGWDSGIVTACPSAISVLDVLCMMSDN